MTAATTSAMTVSAMPCAMYSHPPARHLSAFEPPHVAASSSLSSFSRTNTDRNLALLAHIAILEPQVPKTATERDTAQRFLLSGIQKLSSGTLFELANDLAVDLPLTPFMQQLGIDVEAIRTTACKLLLSRTHAEANRTAAGTVLRSASASVSDGFSANYMHASSPYIDPSSSTTTTSNHGKHRGIYMESEHEDEAGGERDECKGEGSLKQEPTGDVPSFVHMRPVKNSRNQLLRIEAWKQLTASGGKRALAPSPTSTTSMEEEDGEEEEEEEEESLGEGDEPYSDSDAKGNDSSDSESNYSEELQRIQTNKSKLAPARTTWGRSQSTTKKPPALASSWNTKSRCVSTSAASVATSPVAASPSPQTPSSSDGDTKCKKQKPTHRSNRSNLSGSKSALRHKVADRPFLPEAEVMQGIETVLHLEVNGRTVVVRVTLFPQLLSLASFITNDEPHGMEDLCGETGVDSRRVLVHVTSLLQHVYNVRTNHNRAVNKVPYAGVWIVKTTKHFTVGGIRATHEMKEHPADVTEIIDGLVDRIEFWEAGGDDAEFTAAIEAAATAAKQPQVKPVPKVRGERKTPSSNADDSDDEDVDMEAVDLTPSMHAANINAATIAAAASAAAEASSISNESLHASFPRGHTMPIHRTQHAGFAAMSMVPHPAMFDTLLKQVPKEELGQYMTSFVLAMQTQMAQHHPPGLTIPTTTASGTNDMSDDEIPHLPL